MGREVYFKKVDVEVVDHEIPVVATLHDNIVEDTRLELLIYCLQDFNIEKPAICTIIRSIRMQVSVLAYYVEQREFAYWNKYFKSDGDSDGHWMNYDFDYHYDDDDKKAFINEFVADMAVFATRKTPEFDYDSNFGTYRVILDDRIDSFIHKMEEVARYKVYEKMLPYEDTTPFEELMEIVNKRKAEANKDQE